MTAQTPSGASATPGLLLSSKASTSQNMQTRVRRSHPGKQSAITFLAVLTALGLCAFQFGDRYGLNGMPFSQIQPLVSDLAKAQRMAKQGNIELHARQPVRGEAVTLRGELTDANCYLGN